MCCFSSNLYIKLRRSCDLLLRLSFLSFVLVTQLHYADKRILNIMKVYIERNNLQLELIRYGKNVDFIHVYFCEAIDSMQYRPPNAYREVSNTNHFGSISYSLGRLSAASECMTSLLHFWFT